MADNAKSFKDPAYGYIEIPSDLVEDVIDAEAFQRLRQIVQTSYEPLYPSATHNRFVHWDKTRNSVVAVESSESCGTQASKVA